MKTMRAAMTGLLLAMGLGFGVLGFGVLAFDAAPAYGQSATARAAQHPTRPQTAGQGAAANEQATPPDENAPPPHVVATVFVITFRPGPAWVAGLPASQQALSAHEAYWQFHASSGQREAIAEGPFSDIDGRMAIVAAGNLSAARTLAGADPAVRSHLLVAEVHAWTPLIRGPREVPR